MAHGRRAGGPRGGRRTPTSRAATTPPPAGRAPRAGSGIACLSFLSAPASALAPLKVFLKLSLHRRPSSRIVFLRTGA